jgi:serine/threonine protein kinase
MVMLTPVREKYHLLMELGRGGMGVVHLAMTRGPHGFVKLVVLKMLHPELVGNQMARRMFLEEARISARLAHPNVVQVYEVIEFEGSPTMVMEYLEGRPLSTVIGDDPTRLPPSLHLHVCAEVLAGLHAAHELRDYDGAPLNLIHRDVSPHNVSVLFDGRVKVLDFGIAKAARSGIETRTGELKGKIRYMAPEQLRGDRDLDRRADLFAVGVMLWEALASRRMWAGLGDADVMVRLMNNQVPGLPADARVPPKLADVCGRALAWDSADRYASAADFRRDLQRFAGELGPVARPEDLSAFVLERFSQARDATNRLIDAHIKAAETMPPFQPRTNDERATVVGTVNQRTRTVTTHRLRPWLVGAAAAAAGVAGGFAYHARTLPPAPDRIVLVPPKAPRVETARQTCETGFKWCAGECVSIDRPDVGCGNDDCTPCVVASATARCNAHHACDIAVCYQDHDNCDGDPRNGCEAEVRVDPSNCGGCGRRCPTPPHARSGCGDVCTIWRCDDGFRDCNGVQTDGCEVRVSDDAKNCGHCGVACAHGQRCRAGRCAL